MTISAIPSAELPCGPDTWGEEQNDVNSTKPKAILITEDGKNWLCIQQSYAAGLRTNAFLTSSFIVYLIVPRGEFTRISLSDWRSWRG